MEFRPCIDIHNGKVKQIVGGTLTDYKDEAAENFVSEVDASFYADLYRSKGIKGGHVILLNSVNSPEYEATKAQALSALREYPGGLQLGGGVTPRNAEEYLNAGASHVIVTSYVFKDGKINETALKEMVSAVGPERLVLDLSCRKRENRYMIVTDRWQKFTDTELNIETLDMLGENCSEYLIHAVDVEGKASGIETELASMLGEWHKLPVTYAGGVHSYDDLTLLKKLGRNHVNVTIGSALDLFGGQLEFEKVIEYCRSLDMEIL